MKRGFTIIELVFVLIIMGILAGISYKNIPYVIDKAKAQKLSSMFSKAELAYNTGMAEVKYTLPAFSDDKMHCFNFKGGARTTPDVLGNISDGVTQTGKIPNSSEAVRDNSDMSAQSISNMYAFMDRVVRESLITSMGFSSSNSQKGSGLFIPGEPRQKIYLCGRNGLTFIVLSNVKGELARATLKTINESDMSPLDGVNSAKKVAIWHTADFSNNAYSSAFLESSSKDINEGKYTKGTVGAKESSDGKKKPFVNFEEIHNLPAVNMTYLLSSDIVKHGW